MHRSPASHSTPIQPQWGACRSVWLRASFLLVLGACTGSACGGGEASRASGSENRSSSYALHEWGVVTVGQTTTELAAGPGLRRNEPGAFGHGNREPEIVAEKPVLYVHADGPVDIALSVQLGVGYEIAERWPGVGAPLAWEMRASGQRCAEPSVYPQRCESVDGYCEVLELANYTTDDSSCLVMGGTSVVGQISGMNTRASLLFYRLRASTGEVQAGLPVQVHAAANDGQGDSGIFQASAPSPRTAWRVRHDAGGRALVQRFELGAEPTLVPDANSSDAASAAAWTLAQLQERGLTQSEIGAFQNAWWQEIFRIEPTVSLRTNASANGAQEDLVEELPVAVEHVEEAMPPAPTLARDMFIYFLTPEEIDRIAQLEASPAPSATHRAFMVRHYLN